MILRNARYSELAEKIKYYKKRIIIYGAGMIGQVVVPYIIEKYGLQEYVNCYVDMDRQKQGLKVRRGDYDYEIASPDILYKIRGNAIILITNSKFYPIIDFLDDILNLKQIEAYIIPIMQIYELQFASSASIVRQMRLPLIPKKIHYCWFSGKPMPIFLQSCVETWRKLCPEYEIVCWNEDNYDIEKIPYIKEAYEQQKYSFVTDVARLDILYQHGGIYMDTDVTLLRNLDELCYQPAFVGVEKWGNINTGGLCGAIAHHPMIKELLEYRSGYSFVLEDGRLNMETNGWYETMPFIKYGMKIDNTVQQINGVTVYPSSVFHPYDYMSCETKIEENTFSIHHFYGGWMDKDDCMIREKTQNEYYQILRRMNENNAV